MLRFNIDNQLKRKLEYYWDLVFVLTVKEIKIRYKNNVFGYFWSILNPLAFAMIFYLVFGIAMRIKVENYVLFLIVALFPWHWISNSTIASTLIFIQNSNLIKKIKFNKAILPLTIVFQDVYHFIFTIPITIGFMFYYQLIPSWELIYKVPILIFIQIFLTYSISLFLATLNVFFRDIERIIAILMNFVFYATPILYPLKHVPEKYKIYLFLNPFTPLILSWREVFLDNHMNLIYCCYTFIYSILIFIISVIVYRKLSWKFAEVL